MSTFDGIVLVVQLHGQTATATDNLIQALNDRGALQIGNSTVQIAASLVPGPGGVVANAIALGMTGVSISENGKTTVGDIAGLIGSVAGMLAPIAAAAGVPLVAGGLTIAATALAVGGLAYTINGIIEKKKNSLPGTINDAWNSAINWRPGGRDPLAIDLDGDGIETVGIGSNPVLFDHDANGVKTGTGWVKADDAWLVRDIDGDGTIDSGRELFGVDTMIQGQALDLFAPPGTIVTRTATTGFEALRALDADANGVANGVFDANDVAFAEVKLWQDLNQDGISQTGELSTLADKGIASIALNENTTTVNLGNGNSITGTAPVTRTNGGTTQVDSVALEAGNLVLANNPFYREFTDTIPLTAAAQASPEMLGSGWVRDLREAMSLGSTDATGLQSATTQFAQATTRDAQLAVIDSLIANWAKTTGRTIDYTAAGVLGVHQTLVSTVGSVMTIRVTPAEPGDTSGMSLPADLRLRLTNPDFYLPDYISPGLTARGEEVMARLSVLEAFNGGRFVDFTRTLSISGGSGSGSGGGGGGSGGVADPVTHFLVNIADPQVALIDEAYEALRSSVYASLVVQTRLSPYFDLIELTVDETGLHFNSTALAAHLTNLHAADAKVAIEDLADLLRYSEGTLQALGFDGVVMLRPWIDALPADSAIRAALSGMDVWLANTTTGTSRADLYLGDAASNSFFARAGDDLVDGGAGDDVLRGEAGRDTLLGGAGSDTLLNEGRNGVGNDDTYDGGAGNDSLQDIESSDGDVYRLGLGGGQDSVRDDGGVGDRIEVAAGIGAAQVTVRNSYNNLVVRLADGTAMSVNDMYDDNGGVTNRAIEEIRFADGTTWDAAAIRLQASQGSLGADTMFGFDLGDTINAGDGNDLIYARAGDDLVDGGAGDDVLRGEAGRDTLLGGAGSDTLLNEGRNGVGNDDTYDGGAGNDSLQDIESSDGDVYRLGLGGGQDSVRDDGGVGDRIEVAAGIGAAQVTVRNSYNNLVVRLADGTAMSVNDMYDDNGGVTNRAIEEIRFADGTTWDAAAIRLQASQGSLGADTMFGFDLGDTINAGDGNDLIYARAGDDLVDGGAGDDVLRGEAGRDTLLGGAGSDTLLNEGRNGVGNDDTYDGGAGNDSLQDIESSDGDVYRLGLGGGQDSVRDDGGVGDRIEVAAGIGAAQVTVRNSYNNLVVRLADGTAMSVNDMYDDNGGVTNRAIEEIRFADGTTWDAAAIRLQASQGSLGADTMFGFDLGDTINAGDGNDLIYARAGDDLVDGGAGDDVLRGEAGRDTLLGGAGSDTLLNEGRNGVGNDDTYDGGAGNDSLQDIESSDGDVYRLGLGGGQDSVRDDGGVGDRIEVQNGISASQISLTKSASSLVVTVATTAESLTVSNFFNGSTAGSGAIEEIRFADGTVWNQATIIARATSVAPVVANPIADQATAEDAAFSFQLPANAFTDADAGQVLSYTATLSDGLALPAWLAFNAATRTFSGTPANAQVGVVQVKVTATDPLGLSASDVFALAVTNTNDAPTVASALADQAGQAGSAFSYTVPAGSFTDIDVGDTLTYSATLSDGSALPAWLTFNASTRSFGGTPASAGTTSVRVTATDGGGLVASDVFDVVVGAANVLLTGTAGADTLTGGAGADTLNGLAGNDSLVGAAGNDTLDGGAGTDSLVGGAGNDTYIVDATTDVVTEAANEGTDTVRSSVTWTLGTNVENLVLTGTTAINGTGNTLANSLTGNSVNNSLNGGTGADTMAGGAGNDSYTVDNVGDVITELASEGTDGVSSSVTYTLAANVENLTLTGTTAINGTGNTLDNTLTGNSANNTLTGGAGNDTINGGTGNDTMVGGAGNDSYVVNIATDVVTELAGEGTDTVQSSVTLTLAANVENLTLTGTTAINGTGNTLDNVLTGNSANNTLTGDAGDDTINGGTGNDTMVGGAGNDTYVVNIATDVVTELAGEGTDTIQSIVTLNLGSNVENLTLTGTSAINGTGNTLDNVLTGNSANNTLTGGAGNDTIDGGTGNDTMVGGAGNDTYVVNIATDVVTELAGEGTDTIQSSLTLTLGGNVENLLLTGPSAINGTGNTLDNWLTGNSATNTLTGAAGADTLDGAGGNDTLVGGAGADSYRFGRGWGIDTVQENDTTAGVKDLVVLQGTVTQADVAFSQAGNNLEMLISATGDKLVFTNWYLGSQYHAEEFRFTDGSILTDSQAQGLVGAMAAFGASSATSSASSSQVTIGTVNLAPNAMV